MSLCFLKASHFFLKLHRERALCFIIYMINKAKKSTALKHIKLLLNVKRAFVLCEIKVNILRRILGFLFKFIVKSHNEAKIQNY